MKHTVYTSDVSRVMTAIAKGQRTCFFNSQSISSETGLPAYSPLVFDDDYFEVEHDGGMVYVKPRMTENISPIIQAGDVYQDNHGQIMLVIQTPDNTFLLSGLEFNENIPSASLARLYSDPARTAGNLVMHLYDMKAKKIGRIGIIRD